MMPGMPGVMTGPTRRVVVQDEAGKITQNQKIKIHVFHEITDYLELPYRNDLGGKNAVEVADAIKRKIKEKIDAPSEEEVVFMDGVDVELGGKSYHIKRLPANQDREWRRAMGKFISDATNYLRTEFADFNVEGKGEKDENAIGIEAISRAMPYILGDGVDGLREMFWAYAVDLDKAKIEAESEIFSDEINDAAMGVFDMMLPFFVSQGKRIMKMLTKSSALHRPLKQSA